MKAGAGRQPKALHAAAVAVAITVFSLVFIYTGDSDLLFAAASGMSGGLMIYLAAHLRSAGRGEPR